MTDKIMEARRVKFEAYIGDSGSLYFLNGEYFSWETNRAWKTWNAAIDSLIVDLPIEVTNVTNKHYEAGRDDVLQAIHAAGVKTK